jgi:hypothetical protein
MSATICWSTESKSLKIATPSQFIDALRLPRVLDRGDIEFLRGLAAGRSDWRDALDLLIVELEAGARVRVWPEW